MQTVKNSEQLLNFAASTVGQCHDLRMHELVKYKLFKCGPKSVLLLQAGPQNQIVFS